MPVSTSLRPQLYTSIAESTFKEIVSRTSRYYYFIGKVLTWPNELAPPKAIDSVFYEKDTRRNVILVKEIKPSDAALVADRKNWYANVIYDMYDDRYGDEVVGIDLVAGGSSYSSNTYLTISGGGGIGAQANLYISSGIITGVVMIENGYGYASAPNVTITDPDGLGSGANVLPVLCTAYSGANSLANANFYVLTEEFNIYKCLDNNGNSPSTVMPVDVSPEPFLTSDGYKWKFIGSVPPSLKNRFLTDTQMPVASSLTENFYSSGEIRNIIILNGGDNYTTASIAVDGDGYIASDPFYIISADVDNAGNGYTTANVVIDPPIAFSTNWTSSNVFYAGTRIKAGTNIYEVLLSGTTGANPPIHTFGDAINGSTTLKYLATVATGNATISGGNIAGISLDGLISKIRITNGGFGYTHSPQVTITGGGGSGGAGYALINDTGVSKIQLTNLGIGYTSAPSVTIGTEWVANNYTTLNSQVFYNGKLYTVTSANINYRITDAVYSNISANLAVTATPSPTNLQGLYFNNTGTRLYVAGISPTNVTQYDLAYPYDVSSLTNKGNISVTTQDATPTALSFSNTGNIMFVVGTSGDKVYRYNLSSSWNVVTATYVSNLSIADTDTAPTSIFVDASGQRLYVAGTANSRIQAYNMATPWDVANASVGSNVVISGVEATINGLTLSSNGKILTIVGATGDKFSQYYLSNAWDVSSATFYDSYSLANYDSDPRDLYFAEDRDRIYFIGNTTSKIYQFDLPRSVQFGTTAPSHIAGNVYSGDALLAYAGNAATAVATLKYGSGYSREPNIIINGDGGNATASISVAKSEALLLPVIENGRIVNVIIEDGGVGYTNAFLNVTGDGANASLFISLSEGDIQTLQGNNELLSVDGAIEAIKMVSGGYGYSSANVSIAGDGFGASANAVVNNGRVTSIVVDTAGSGYTFADIIIDGNGSGASARAIIPPEGGHGADIVSELYTRSLALYSTIAGERNQGFTVTNDYRQVGIIKNIRTNDSESFYTKIIGSGCHVLSGNTSNSLILDDVILTSSRNNARFQVVAKTNSEVLVVSLDKSDPVIGERMLLNGATLFTVTGVVAPDIDKYSGELLYIDNREAFTTAGQFVSIKTVFKY